MEEASKVDGGLPEDLQGILTQSLTTVNADIDDVDKVVELFSLLPDIDFDLPEFKLPSVGEGASSVSHLQPWSNSGRFGIVSDTAIDEARIHYSKTHHEIA